jgi:hypothetical protein
VTIYNEIHHTPQQVSPENQDQAGAVFMKERKLCIKEIATSTPFNKTQDLFFKAREKLSFKRVVHSSNATNSADYGSRSYLSFNSNDYHDDYKNKGKLPEIINHMGQGTKYKRTIPTNDKDKLSSSYFSSDSDFKNDDILPLPDPEDHNYSDDNEELFPSSSNDRA